MFQHWNKPAQICEEGDEIMKPYQLFLGVVSELSEQFPQRHRYVEEGSQVVETTMYVYSPDFRLD